MLKDSLYHIIAIDHTDSVIHAVLELDAQHEIFTGHFPDHPVLPGACMVQMIKEVFESAMGTPYRLEKADNLKFLTIVDPQQTSTLQLELNYIIEELLAKVNAELVTDEGIAFKFQGSFVCE